MSLPPRAFRTLYNVADALDPAADAEAAARRAAALPRAVSSLPDCSALHRTLACLEREARLRDAPWRGFSWLSRPERRAALARLERSPFAFRRRAFERLRDVVERAAATVGPEAER